MDDADRTDAHIDARIADGIDSVRRRPSLKPTGFCHNCGEDVHSRHIFCPGGECQKDYEYRTKIYRGRHK